MRLKYFSFISLLLLACNADVAEENETSPCDEKVDVDKWRNEILSVDSLEMTGLTFPDSIVKYIDFEITGVEVRFPQLTLQQGMGVDKICELFPESCKLVLQGGNLWSGHIELRASNKGLDPRRVFLVFRNQKLVKMVIHTFSLK